MVRSAGAAWTGGSGVGDGAEVVTASGVESWDTEAGLGSTTVVAGYETVGVAGMVGIVLVMVGLTVSVSEADCSAGRTDNTTISSIGTATEIGVV